MTYGKVLPYSPADGVEYNYYTTMKGVIEEYFDALGMDKKVTYDPNAGKVFLHPGRQASIIYGG